MHLHTEPRVLLAMQHSASVASDPGDVDQGNVWDGGSAELGDHHSCFLCLKIRGHLERMAPAFGGSVTQ